MCYPSQCHLLCEWVGGPFGFQVQALGPRELASAQMSEGASVLPGLGQPEAGKAELSLACGHNHTRICSSTHIPWGTVKIPLLPALSHTLLGEPCPGSITSSDINNRERERKRETRSAPLLCPPSAFQGPVSGTGTTGTLLLVTAGAGHRGERSLLAFPIPFYCPERWSLQTCHGAGVGWCGGAGRWVVVGDEEAKYRGQAFWWAAGQQKLQEGGNSWFGAPPTA